MTTSQTDTIFIEPVGNTPIDPSARLYFGGLTRHLGHEFLLDAFERSGLSKSDLAARLGYDPSRLGRILNTPANLTLETFGEVLFAIDGSCTRFLQQWPLRDQSHNYAGPDWLMSSGQLANAGQYPGAYVILNMGTPQALPISGVSSSVVTSIEKMEAA